VLSVPDVPGTGNCGAPSPVHCDDEDEKDRRGNRGATDRGPRMEEHTCDTRDWDIVGRYKRHTAVCAEAQTLAHEMRPIGAA